jgi:hypothetical protein
LLKLYAGGLQDRSDVLQLLAGDTTHRARDQVDERVGDLPGEARTVWKLLRGAFDDVQSM